MYSKSVNVAGVRCRFEIAQCYQYSGIRLVTNLKHSQSMEQMSNMESHVICDTAPGSRIILKILSELRNNIIIDRMYC